MRLRRVLGLVAIASTGLVGSCGGLLGPEPSGTPPFDAGPRDEAGYSACETPEGWGICGRSTGCPSGSERTGCLNCSCPSHGPDAGPSGASSLFCTNDPIGSVGVCDDALSAILGVVDDGGSYLTALCADGYARYDWLYSGLGPLCVPYSIAKIEFRYVADPDRVRYADFGAFDGKPLPSPGNCPVVEGITLCGGTCTPCPAGTICTSRSPRHPYGFCTEPLDISLDACRLDGSGPGPGVCNPKKACFTFAVEPAAQPLADRHGVCLPLDECHALAAGLPGGGRCTPP